jgi:hypothetical protein
MLLTSTSAVRVKPGACSEAVGYVFNDINGALVSAPRALTVIYQPSNFLEFYSDASCQSRVLSTDLPAGSPGGEIHVRGATAGVFTLRAISPGLNQGTFPVFVSQPDSGCASAGAGWAALGIVALIRRRS